MELARFLGGMADLISLPMYEMSLIQEGEILTLTLSRPSWSETPTRVFFNQDYTAIYGKWVVVGWEDGNNIPSPFRDYMEAIFSAPEQIVETDWDDPPQLGEGESLKITEGGITFREGEEIYHIRNGRKYVI